MCLDVLDKVRCRKHVQKEGNKLVGWKTFTTRNGKKLHFQFLYGSPLVNQWIKQSKYAQDRNKYLYCDFSTSRYSKGFHFYLSKEDAYRNLLDDEVVRKIYFRKPITFGLQSNSMIGVAKEIFICNKKISR